MTPLNLFNPALAHFDLAIAGVGAVADNEVVCHAVLHAALFVIGIEDAGISTARPAVVDHDVFPVAKIVYAESIWAFTGGTTTSVGAVGVAEAGGAGIAMP